MAKKPAPPHKSDTPRKIVAFDFDGTLTYTDSFTRFLQVICGNWQIASTMAFKPGMLLNYVRTQDRGALKSQLIYQLLGPISQADLETRVQAFVAKTGMSLFRPDALRAWKDHESPDTMRVIVTASPDILVRPFGALIGADRVIGTKLGISADGHLLPDLDGVNCRGPEKVRRLKEAFGEDIIIDSAYGDTSGDFDMIKAARNGHYRVFKEKP